MLIRLSSKNCQTLGIFRLGIAAGAELNSLRRLTSSMNTPSSAWLNYSVLRVVRWSVLLARLFVVTGCHQDPHVSAEKHYAQAQLYLQQKQTEAAFIELSRAVQLSPEMGKAHHDLANLYLQRREVSNALSELLLTIRYNPSDHEAYTTLGELLLRTRDLKKAKEIAGELTEKWPDDHVAKLILAEGMMASGSSTKARELVEQVVKEDSKNPRAFFDLAKLDLQNKQWDHAGKNLRLTWEFAPADLVAPLLLSRVLEARGDLPQAESVLKRLAEAHAEKVDPLYALAGFYIRQKKLGQAEQSFKQIQIVGRANPKDRSSLAIFYQATGRLEAAENEFRRILAEDPNDKASLRRSAEIKVRLNKPGEAKQIATDLLNKDPKDWEALLLLARLDVDDGKVDGALQELDRANAIHPQSPMLNFLIARCYLLQGKPELAKASLSEVLKIAPDFSPARIMMAELELKSGQTRVAIQDLNRALERKPSSVSPYLLLSQAYALQGDFNLAEESLNPLLNPKISKTDQAMVFQTLAWVRLREQRYAEAIQLCNKSLSMGSITLEGLRVLGLSYLGLNQPEQGLKAVESILSREDHWAPGQQLLAELALQAKKLDIAEKAFQKELEINPQSTAPIYGIAEVQRGRGQYDASRESFERFALAEPANAAVHVQLGGLAELRKDWPQAISQYETALKLDSKYAIAKNNLAWLYAEHGGNISVALRLAQEARSALPKDPHVADTLGWLLVKIGSAQSAVPYLKECIGAIPANPAYHYHLGTAYFKAGQTEQAKQELQTALRLRDSFEGSDEAKKTLDTIKSPASN
jgi:tetratricopeptide (TPR) repeat protein